VGWGRRCGLGPVLQGRTRVASCPGHKSVGFSYHALKSGHDQGEWGLERAGQGWRGDMASMPCRFMCYREGKGACIGGNTSHALGFHGACSARLERGLWGGLRAAWSAAAGWAMGAVCLGIHWRGCRRWRAVEAPVSNGSALVSIGVREREW
jgi:hypothetical protein